jgi:hypothetical protein
MEPITLKTDELHETIYGLQKLAATLPLVIQNSYEWKWVLIIAHNTFQAFMFAGSCYLILLGFVHLLMHRMTPLDEQLHRIRA